MFPKDLSQVCMFYTLTPLHAGAGQALGAVDLPIQRERHTGWPHVQSSGVKGAFRDWFYQYYAAKGTNSQAKDAKELTDRVFGKEEGGEQSGGQAGAVSLTDARLLAFPVRSNVAPYVCTTCPAILTRLRRDLVLCGFSGNDIPVPTLSDPHGFLSVVGISNTKAVLEDLAVSAESPAAAEPIERIKKLFGFLAPEVTRLILISDQNFSFLVKTATEIQPQIKINIETGTAQDGSLRYQELLPSDSVLYTLAFFAQERVKDGLAPITIKDRVLEAVSTHIQMGGDVTLGRGIIQVRWVAPTAFDGGSDE